MQHINISDLVATLTGGNRGSERVAGTTHRGPAHSIDQAGEWNQGAGGDR
jgi:hypothetical protein